MTVVIPPGYMHVIQPSRHSSASKDWTTTYAVSVADPQAGIDEADELYRTAWVARYDSNQSILPAVGYYRNLLGDLVLVQSTLPTITGTGTLNAAPPNCTFVVSKRTQFVGRKHRGRCFIPLGVSEGQVDENGVLLPGTVSAMQTAADGWLASMESSTILTGMELLHSDVSLAPSPVTSLVVQNVVRTQRRRLP